MGKDRRSLGMRLFPEEDRQRWTRRVWTAGLAVTALLVVVHLVNARTVDIEILDMNTEQTIPSWATTFVFTLAGLAAVRLGAHREHRLWLAMGALMLAFSLDDVAMLHERMEDVGGEGVALLAIEPLIALAVAVLFAALARRLEGTSRRLLLGSLAALVVAQAASTLGSRLDDVPQALVVVEEAGELVVGVLVIAAIVDPLLAALDRRYVRAPAQPAS